MSTGSSLSAIAATIAAVLAAVNLYLTGKRERNRWAREVLIDVFVTFLNAGFEGNAACNRLADSPGIDGEEDGTLDRGRIADAHQTETDMLTKMRLLTRPAVIEAAMNLHLATHAYIEFVQDNLPRVPESERSAAQKDLGQARRSFLAAAKSEIGLEAEVSSVEHEPTR